jgi:hypothetical protein
MSPSLMAITRTVSHAFHIIDTHDRFFMMAVPEKLAISSAISSIGMVLYSVYFAITHKEHKLYYTTISFFLLGALTFIPSLIEYLLIWDMQFYASVTFMAFQIASVLYNAQFFKMLLASNRSRMFLLYFQILYTLITLAASLPYSIKILSTAPTEFETFAYMISGLVGGIAIALFQVMFVAFVFRFTTTQEYYTKDMNENIQVQYRRALIVTIGSCTAVAAVGVIQSFVKITRPHTQVNSWLTALYPMLMISSFLWLFSYDQLKRLINTSIEASAQVRNQTYYV